MTGSYSAHMSLLDSYADTESRLQHKATDDYIALRDQVYGDDGDAPPVA